MISIMAENYKPSKKFRLQYAHLTLQDRADVPTPISPNGQLASI